MEALGAAASVVSLATILAQLIDGVTQLHGFWTSVKEVPKSLTWLSTDLEILHDILQSIESSSAQLSQTGDTSPFFRNSQAGDKPVKRAWRSVKAVFDSKKIESYRENLESAKATKQGLGTITSLQCHLATLSLEQARANTDILATSNEIKESVSQLGSILDQKIQSMALLTALSHENPLASFISSSVEKTISSVVQNTLKDISSQTQKTRVPRCRKACCRGRMPISDANELPGDDDDARLSKSTNGPGIISENGIETIIVPQERPISEPVGRQDRKRKKYNHRFWKTYKTIFGTVSIHSCEVATEALKGTSKLPFTEADTCSTEIEIQFTPRLWLARTASSILGAVESAQNRSTWKFNIQYYPVVDENSDIFQACREGDIKRMRNLFNNKQASPNDITQRGENLMMCALNTLGSRNMRFETCNLLLESGWRGSENFNGIYPLDLVFNLGPYDIYGVHNGLELCSLYEDDLKIARLLVERVGVEHLASEFFIASLYISTSLSPPFTPPALEYLCKQDRLDFSIKNIVREASPAVDWKLPIASALKVLLDCGVELSDLNRKDEYELILKRILSSFFRMFNNPDDQRIRFNETVLEFTTLLRAGVDPYAHHDSVNLTVTELVQLDPDFTEVAWNLALELNGWENDEDNVTDETSPSVGGIDEDFTATTIANDSESGDPDGQVLGSGNGNDSEHEEEKGNEIEDNSPSEVDETDACPNIPSAWIEEEPVFPICRKFRSKRSDFTGTSETGVVWPRHMYIGRGKSHR
ncbi:hypothetical protein V8E51_007172 [Hyaloscypha variabilis]